MCCDGGGVRAVVGRVVDHEHVGRESPPARGQRRETPLEVVARVVVDDDDREVGRLRPPAGSLVRGLRDEDDAGRR